MGMFDYIRAEYQLPHAAAQNLDFQTKCFDHPYMDHYLIKADGTLCIEDYDIEDRSDPNAEGILRLFGCMTKINKRWRQLADFEGAVEFYSYPEPYHYRAIFIEGKLAVLRTLEEPEHDAQSGVIDAAQESEK